MPERRLPSRHLTVIFDSNSIYNESPKYLMPLSVAELVRKSPHDLHIDWLIPVTVRHERQYQIMKNAKALIQQLRRADHILGFQLQIDADTIERRVAESITSQMAELNVQELQIDYGQIDWSRVLQDACYRRPPFSADDSEKGFRDALIVEAFVQFVEKGSISGKASRIVLVSDDSLLRTAAESRVSQYRNVSIIPDYVELQNLINVLSSEVSEEFAERFREPASLLFFIPNDENTLYYKWHIRDQIVQKFKSIMENLPPDATSRRGVRTLIGRATFVNKIRQRVTWESRISLLFEAFKQDPLPPASAQVAPPGPGSFQYPPTVTGGRSPLFEGITIQGPSEFRIDPGGLITGLTSSLAPASRMRSIGQGRDIFKVLWSASISQKTEKLLNPRLDGIEYVETNWPTETVPSLG